MKQALEYRLLHAPRFVQRRRLLNLEAKVAKQHHKKRNNNSYRSKTSGERWSRCLRKTKPTTKTSKTTTTTTKTTTTTTRGVCRLVETYPQQSWSRCRRYRLRLRRLASPPSSLPGWERQRSPPETSRMIPSDQTDQTKPNQTELNQIKPNQTEPSRTEPNRTEPNRTEPNRTEPNRTKPNQTRTKPNQKRKPNQTNRP